MTERPPFVALDETTAWKGRRLTVRRRRYRGPQGDEFEREFAHHPGAVGVIALDDDHRVVLVRQFRAPMQDWVLEMPAGTRDVDGEPPEETAQRELAEEVGLEADHWRLLAALPVSPGVTDQVTLVYLATGLHPCETAREGPEERAMVVERLGLSEVMDRVEAGELMDAPTVAGVALARLVLDAGGR